MSDQYEDSNHLQQHSMETLDAFSSDLQKKITSRIQLIETLMLNEWLSIENESQLYDYNRYLHIAPLFYNYSDSFIALNWINSTGVIKWVYPYERNLNALEMNVTYYSSGSGGINDAFAIARDQHKTGFTRYSQFYQGGGGFVAYVPIVYQQEITGYFNIVFEITSIINCILKEHEQFSEYSFHISENGTLVTQINEEFNMTDSYVSSIRIDFFNRNMDISVRPCFDLIYDASLIRLLPTLLSMLFLCLITYLLTNRLKLKNMIIKREFDEKSRLQTQIFQSRKMKALGRISGGVAHDFNNIMQNIQSHTDIIYQIVLPNLKQGKLEEECINDLDEASQAILKNLLRSKELTSQILAFSRQNTFNFKIIDIGQVIKDSIRLVRETASQGITFKYNYEKILILGTEIQMVQVIMNLLINAVDAVEDATGEIKVIVVVTPSEWNDSHYQSLEESFTGTLFEREDFLSIKVIDNGKGMNQEHQDSAFDPFFTTKETGAGLGLGIVHQNVVSMGGMIRLTSTFSEGTTFIINLPIPKNAVLESVKPGRTIDHSVLQHTKILVVDDEEDIRRSLEVLLSKKGIQVQLANDGEEAWEIMSTMHFDLIILDVKMPKLGGIKLYRRILNINSEQRVIFLSGFSDEKIDFEGISRIEKPVDIDVLMEEIIKELSRN